MRFAPLLLAISCAAIVSGCGNSVTKPTSIGGGKYIMSAQAKPSPFGVASAVNMGKLIEEASASCTNQGLRFVLLGQQQNPGSVMKLGNGSVTYKCEK